MGADAGTHKWRLLVCTSLRVEYIASFAAILDRNGYILGGLIDSSLYPTMYKELNRECHNRDLELKLNNVQTNLGRSRDWRQDFSSGDLPVISLVRVVIKDSGMPVSGMAGTAGLTEGCRWNNAAAGYAGHPDGPGRSHVIQGHVRVGQGSRRNPLLDGIHAGLRQAKASRYGVTRRDALCHHRSTASAYSRAIPRCLPRTTCICCSGAARARCHRP